MSSPNPPACDTGVPAPEPTPGGPTRRRFLTYLLAVPTLAVGVRYADAVAAAPVPSGPAVADVFDLGDLLILAGKDTEGMLIVLEVGEDGVVRCALPRMEVGQGLTTSVAMIIAEEMELPLDKVQVTLADARRELARNQLTGGSNTIRSVYAPTRQAAAAAKGRLLEAAARRLAVPAATLTVVDGVVRAADGRSVTYGDVARAAADPALVAAAAPLKEAAAFTRVGKGQRRVDALAMVTGRQKYTLDLDVPGALPTMVRRPPTNGAPVRKVLNEAAVRAMPGVVDLVVVPTGVAVLARTFGQALDAKEALEVSWGPGPVETQSNETVLTALKAAALPVPPAPPGTTVIDAEFDFAPVSHAPLETNTAIARITPAGGEVWSGMKSPIVAGQVIERELGLPEGSVKAHVVQAGGSFGRRLFFDGALEAARISQASGGRTVKLLWSRVDDMRHGRTRPASFHRVRAVVAQGTVASFDHQVSSVQVDWTHGLGEIFSAMMAEWPNGNKGYGQSVFDLTVKSPYDLGRTVQHLEEIDVPFHTAAWRSVYSANTRGAEEIVLDEVAKAVGKDPAQFRLEHLKTERQRAVLRTVMTEGGWGKRMDAGTAQGIAYHEEYRSLSACLVEVDARGPGRPRVTKAVLAADYGLPINPTGLEAQLLGGLTDAIATTFRAGLHYDRGLPLEGSYSQFHYARQAQTPTDVKIIILPATSEEPGGAGELGLPAAVGAIANAYARATGTKPRRFPLFFDVDFEPFPRDGGSTRRHVEPPAQEQ